MEENGLAVASGRLRDMLSPHENEDARLMQKGMLLYRQGMVSQLRISGNSVTAQVQDVVPVRVRLELDFMEMSECSCPGHGICRHVLAVFFTAYGRSGGSVAEWLEDWRYPVREKQAAAAWGLQRARDLVKASGVIKPDYDKWIESFEESFTSIMRTKKHLSPYVVSELFDVFWRRVNAGEPSAREWGGLYELAAVVFSCKELARLGAEVGHTEEMVVRYYLHLFSSLEEKGVQLARRLGNQALPLSSDAFLESLRADVRGLLTVSPSLVYERTFLYMGIWTFFFRKRDWLEEELERIREDAKTVGDGDNGLPLVIAAAHLNIMLKNDAVALDYLAKLEGNEAPPFMLYWIEQLTVQKEWDRLGPLIEQLVHRLKGVLGAMNGFQGRTRLAKDVLDTALPYIEETGRTELLERILHQSLPYSYYQYGNLLFERGEYAKWADLQAYMGYQYSDLPTASLKVLEKELPDAVISMLHQSAAKLIAGKNRPGYRSAVRMLKKLRTLYKKQKRLNEWEEFFEALLERTKRLRAFHEECQRSKLIDG